ncbi:sialidase family protein [Parabacteroides sp. ASD2025]|uniref:sialidase family protein n=1 Tax=Parabacteroides sp. ASD2025 TaxID=3415987 RepID=UPI00262AAC9C|nr:sialidase family protein [uncultured Parabacteroides sp.]
MTKNINSSWICFILVFCFMSCSSEDIEEEILTYAFKSESLFIKSSLDIPRRSEGDIIQIREDLLLLVYTKFHGNYYDHSPATLVKRISTDRGKSWSDEVEFINRENSLNVMSASLLKLNNNTIALFYLIKNSNTDCYPVVRFSNDNAETWSEPIACIKPQSGYFVMNNSRAIQLSTGRIIIPVSKHSFKNGEFQGDGTIYCYYSDDLGKTWKQGKPVPSTQSQLIFQEPGIIELLNGNILMYIRTNGGWQYYSYSKDEGHSWSKVTASTLQSPLSPASIARNPYNDALIAVWNMSSQERMPLCFAASIDEGQTWKNKSILENKKGYSACYPAIEFLSANELLILYSIAEKEKMGLGSLKLVYTKY